MPVLPSPLSEAERILDGQLSHPSELQVALLTARARLRRRTSWLAHQLTMGLIQTGAVHCGFRPPTYGEYFGLTTSARGLVYDRARSTRPA